MKMQACVLFAALCPLIVCAQLDVPVRITLDAPIESNRHITGLADPLMQDAGVSLGASRTLSTTWAVGTGSTVIVADLVPPALTYSTSMTVTIVPIVTNANNVQLNLNDLGPVPIVTNNGAPLDSGALQPNIPARFIFDGVRFVLLNEAFIPCKFGYTMASVDLCIETNSHDTATFFEALENCAANGARLCRYAEWVAACQRDPNFMASVPDMEWVDSAANHLMDAKVVGVGYDGQTLVEGAGCNYGSTRTPSLNSRYRCCSNR